MNDMHTIYVGQDPVSGWFCKKNLTNRWARDRNKLEDFFTPILGQARIYNSVAKARCHTPPSCEIIAFVCTQIGGKQSE